MKKLLLIALMVALLAGLGAYADADAHYQYGYVLDITPGGFEIITDNQEQLAFTTSDATQIRGDGSFDMDSAVVVTYIGQLNAYAVQQAVEVSEVTVLSTLYGTVDDATMNTITVSSRDDGQKYLFSRETADIVVGEDGVLVGDEIEVAYKGGKDALIAGQVQAFDFVHITDYGQDQNLGE